ncbi:hypothetical protein [Burkholderia pseudomultivorans]|uniref:hypothetical protein n=1 Tax=Burkholderia pseudomultivorans TaxID=1207504 RepID=UPI000B106AC8
MIVFFLKRFAGLFVVLFLTTILGCADKNQSNPSDVSGYNYTDYYIAGFRVGSEGEELPAGGPNIFPKRTVKRARVEGNSCAASAFPPIGVRA